jgi:mRNA-degrading endonuclease RelE of RelBE toxin-antitoxin system
LDFKCTQTFENDIHDLTKKPSDGYSNVKSDISKQLDGISIEDAYQIGDCLRYIGTSKLVKLRVGNSSLGLGKSKGYRLIYLVSKNKNQLILCHIYPKRGKFSKSDITDTQVASIISEVLRQVSDQTLTNPDFIKSTEEKVIQKN